MDWSGQGFSSSHRLARSKTRASSSSIQGVLNRDSGKRNGSHADTACWYQREIVSAVAFCVARAVGTTRTYPIGALRKRPIASAPARTILGVGDQGSPLFPG